MQMVAWKPAPEVRGAFLPQIRMAAGAPRQPMFGQRPTFGGDLGRARLGVTASEWADRARAALRRFEFLKGQLETIDNKLGRDKVLLWLGSASVEGDPEYRYNSVLWNFNQTQTQGVEGVYADPDRGSARQGRIEDLEAKNNEFTQKIADAQGTYGTRVVPGRAGVVQQPAPTPDLVTPIAIGVGVVVLAIFVAPMLRGK